MKSPRKRTPTGCLSGVFFCVALCSRGGTEGYGEHKAAVSAGDSLFSSGLAGVRARRRQPENQPNRELDSQFQSAVAQYDAGRFAEAAAQLEDLLPHAPKSFEIHELLGLVYAALSQDAKAIEHLETAVRLKPDSADCPHQPCGGALSRRKRPARRRTIPQSARAGAERLRRQP